MVSFLPELPKISGKKGKWEGGGDSMRMPRCSCFSRGGQRWLDGWKGRKLPDRGQRQSSGPGKSASSGGQDRAKDQRFLLAPTAYLLNCFYLNLRCQHSTDIHSNPSRKEKAWWEWKGEARELHLLLLFLPSYNLVSHSFLNSREAQKGE